MPKATTTKIVLLDADRKNPIVIDVESVPDFRCRHAGHYFDLCDTAATEGVNDAGEVIYPAGTRRYVLSGKA